MTYFGKDNYLYAFILELENFKILYDIDVDNYLEEYNFFKIIFLKNKINLILLSDIEFNTFYFIDFEENYAILKSLIIFKHTEYEATYHFSIKDIMAFTENKIIILSQKHHGRAITIYILNFFCFL